MMRQFIIAGIVLSHLTAGVMAGDKIATVDMARLLSQHPQTEINRHVIEEALKEFENEQKAMLADMENIRKQAQRAGQDAKNEALTDDARAGLVKEAREKLLALRDYEQEAREKLMKRQKELSDQRVRMRRLVVGKIRDVVEAYAKKNGFVMVLDASGLTGSGSEVVLYRQDNVDITPDIVTILDKKK